jgi:multidrug efflux pump subunit AcrB
MPEVSRQLFAFSERSQFLLYLGPPRGSDIAATKNRVLRLSDWLTADVRLTDVISFVGFAGSCFITPLNC